MLAAVTTMAPLRAAQVIRKNFSTQHFTSLHKNRTAFSDSGIKPQMYAEEQIQDVVARISRVPLSAPSLESSKVQLQEADTFNRNNSQRS